MNQLQLLDKIKKLDKQNVYASVLALPDQCLHAWNEANQVKIPHDYKNVENVVMCGMGGSGLGARVIESLYFSKLSKPLTRVNDYHLPLFVNEKSLVFISSYSGNTEETVQNINEALERKAKILVIGSGGKLIEKAKENNLPYYQIVPTYNPSNQPRMAIGYSIIGQLVFAMKAGLLEIKKEDVDKSVSIMKKIFDVNDIDKDETPDSLKIANSMKGKIILYVSSEHLVGATHVVNNQQNENAKNLSFDFAIPELNHHLMEGLKHPATNSKNILFFFINSEFYSSRVRQRFEITTDVVGQNNIPSVSYKVNSDDKFSQVFELIQFGAFLNFYLTMLNGINPAPIPWVDYFKEKLGNI